MNGGGENVPLKRVLRSSSTMSSTGELVSMLPSQQLKIEAVHKEANESITKFISEFNESLEICAQPLSVNEQPVPPPSPPLPPQQQEEPVSQSAAETADLVAPSLVVSPEPIEQEYEPVKPGNEKKYGYLRYTNNTIIQIVLASILMLVVLHLINQYDIYHADFDDIAHNVCDQFRRAYQDFGKQFLGIFKD